MKKTYGVGRDWPIDYDDLEDYYVEAERELGVSGNHEELDGLFGGHRSRPFPMPGQALTYSDQLVKQRIDGLRSLCKGNRLIILGDAPTGAM